MWGSYYNIPKAIYYLLKGDYNGLGFKAPGFGLDGFEGFVCLKGL